MPDIGRDGKYDCAILDSSGNEIGLILTRDKDRALNYMETTDTALAQQYFSGTPGYTNLQPEKEWQGGQDDWRSGFGQEYYDASDPLRYYESFDVDGRFKGMAICGPEVTSFALVDYSATITDGGMELWDNSSTLTNWSFSNSGAGEAALAQEGTTKRTGTYSAKIDTIAGSAGYFGQIDQSPTWNDKYQGVIVEVTCYVYQDSANIAVLKIYDGVGTTSSATSATTGSFVQLTATRTIDGSATELTIQVRSTGNNVNTFVDDIVWEYPVLDKAVCMADFNDERYVVYGDVLAKLNGTGNGFTYIRNFGGVKPTWLFPFSDDNLYICMGNSAAKYYYMNTSESFTQSTLGDGYARWMSAVGDIVYKVVQPKETKTATDPTNAGSWSAASNIGATAENITFQVLDQAGTPIYPKEDMPYYKDSDGNIQRLIPSLISEKATGSGRNALVWQGSVYYPCGTQALYEYSASGIVTDISPSKYITNSANFDGHIEALASDAQYLFVLVKNVGITEILAGRRETIGGSTTWVWHPIAREITAGDVEFAGASTIYARRIWFTNISADIPIAYYIPSPQEYGNITADSSYSFQTGGNIITPWIHAGFKADKKAFYKITLTMADTTANIYWEAHYQKLGDASWTDIGDFKTSPTTEKYLPVDGSSNEPESTMLRFKFVPVTNSTSSTPVLLNYDVRAVWYPKQREIILLQMKVADNLKLHNDLTEETQTAASIRTIISELANPTTTWPRKFYPPYYETSGDEKYVKLLPPAQYRQVKNEETRNPEWVYDLQLLIVDGLTF